MNILSRLLFIICFIFVVSCKGDKNMDNKDIAENTTFEQDRKYVSVGEEIDPEDAATLSELSEKLATLKTGDTIQTKVIAEVNEVCQAKGCWMTLASESEQPVMVKFKDYGFFVPKDISGKEVIIKGSVFLDEVSVEDQKHYAMDEGKSEDEIAKITEPKMSFAIIADGVLIAED